MDLAASRVRNAELPRLRPKTASLVSFNRAYQCRPRLHQIQRDVW